MYTKFEVCRPFRLEDALLVSTLCRPADLLTFVFDLLKLVRIIARGLDNFPTNFGVSVTFRSRLIGLHLSDASHDRATLTLTLEVTGLVADAGLPAPSV